MNESYQERIRKHLPNMTKGLRKVGNHLLNEPIAFATHPAKKVGKMIDVSETMVLRFCNAIGYKGYMELQKEVREELLHLSQTMNEGEGRFHQSIEADIHHLRWMKKQMDTGQMERIVQNVIDSERIVVAGYYHSFSYAHWLFFNLNYILGNVLLFRPESDAGILDLLPGKSTLIVFSFYRYAVDTIELAKKAKEKGIYVIAITDSLAAPTEEFADEVIPIHTATAGESLLQKGPMTISFINAWIHEIIRKVENQGKMKPTFNYYIKDGESEGKSDGK